MAKTVILVGASGSKHEFSEAPRRGVEFAQLSPCVFVLAKFDDAERISPVFVACVESLAVSMADELQWMRGQAVGANMALYGGLMASREERMKIAKDVVAAYKPALNHSRNTRVEDLELQWGEIGHA